MAIYMRVRSCHCLGMETEGTHNMPMVKRLKIVHPRHNLVWDHDAADWTNNADDATEWPLIEEDEAYTLADEVGGMVEQYTRYSTLADVYAGNMGAVV